jgi:hypothetical protein
MNVCGGSETRVVSLQSLEWRMITDLLTVCNFCKYSKSLGLSAYGFTALTNASLNPSYKV